jgi:hypothetical protein
MLRRKLLSTLFAVTVPMFAMSCDDGTPDPITQQDFPLCAQNTMRVVGTIDDMSIDVTLPGTGGLSQDNEGGDFCYQCQDAPTQPDLRLFWNELTPRGRIVAATGTLRLVEGPVANETFCGGEGSVILMPKDESAAVIQFGLVGLRSGQGCDLPRTGQLLGCVNW